MPINKVDDSVGGEPGEMTGVVGALDTAELGDELLPGNSPRNVGDKQKLTAA
jgi:hypothetical protein